MRDVRNTIEIDEMYLDELKALKDDINRASLELIEDTVKITNKYWELTQWCDEIMKSAGYKPNEYKVNIKRKGN